MCNFIWVLGFVQHFDEILRAQIQLQFKELLRGQPNQMNKTKTIL